MTNLPNDVKPPEDIVSVIARAGKRYRDAEELVAQLDSKDLQTMEGQVAEEELELARQMLNEVLVMIVKPAEFVTLLSMATSHGDNAELIRVKKRYINAVKIFGKSQYKQIPIWERDQIEAEFNSAFKDLETVILQKSESKDE